MGEKILIKTNHFYHYLLLVLTAVFFSFHYFKNIPDTPPFLALAFIFYAALLKYKKNFSHRNYGLVLSTSSIVLFFVFSAFTGGIHAPAMKWFHCVFLHVCLVNSAHRIKFILAFFLTCFISLLLLQNYHFLPISKIQGNQQLIHYISTVSSIMVSFILLYFYKQFLDTTRKLLHKTNERNDLIIRSVNTGIYDWDDLSQDKVYWSPLLYKILGYEENEIEASASFYNGLINKEDFKKIELVNHNKDYLQNEYRIKTKSGKEIWVENTGIAIRDKDNNIVRYVGALKDISELKNAYIKLEKEKENALQAAKAKALFLSNMTHEIRTPLTAIIGLSELLKDKSQNNREELIDGISLSANHLLEIVNNILDYNKIEEGKMKLSLEPVNLNNFIQNLSLIYEPLLDSKNVLFEIDSQINSNYFYNIDSTKLMQILNNIIGNSIKFTENGKIKITYKENNDVLSFVIEDSGIGIEEDKIDLIFESFEQIDSTLSKSNTGTGLGLTITKNLIQLMNGDIKITSKFGEGTRVSFFIKATRTNLREITPQNFENQFSKVKVLLAEDNMLNIKMMKAHFNFLKIDFDLALNGEEAIEMASKKKYDLILMDMQMPKIDGLQATKTIRKTSKFKPYIVSFTANNPENKELFDNILPKPIKRDHLVKVINSYLVQSKAA